LVTSVSSSSWRLLLWLVTRSIGALVAQVLMVTRESVLDGCGREGTEVLILTKLKALVRSPTAERRHEDRLGTSAPKRVSRKRNSEVWSKVPCETKPPRAKGETMSRGTRKPSPIGPATPEASEGRGLAVMYSPSVAAGAVGGGTWSKKPPFSSWVMKRAGLRPHSRV
jgi:hypothetical protein